MQLDYAQLPETAQVIADVIGVEKTLQLARLPQVSNNRSVYIPTPKRLGDSHWLVQALGETTARKLSEEYPGFQLSLARCTSAVKRQRNEKIVAMREQNVSNADIAKEFGMTVSAVKMVYSRWCKAQTTH